MKRKYRVETTPSAEKDLDGIWDYISESNPKNAVVFLNQLEGMILSLDAFPERHAVIPEDEILQGKYRHLVYKNYRIIYRVQEDVVYILRIIRSSKLLDE